MGNADGQALERALLNLSNITDATTGEFKAINGDSAHLRVMGGLAGEAYLDQAVPLNDQLGSTKFISPCSITHGQKSR